MLRALTLAGVAYDLPTLGLGPTATAPALSKVWWHAAMTLWRGPGPSVQGKLASWEVTNCSTDRVAISRPDDCPRAQSAGSQQSERACRLW